MRDTSPLARFLTGTKRENVNVFSNGVGKLLTFHLLSLLPLEEVNVRIATTNDPRHDWCGENQQHISGVVDVAVVSGGKWLVVGEVKSDNSVASCGCQEQLMAIW